MKERIERMQGEVYNVLSVLRETVESRPQATDPNRRYALARIEKHHAALVKANHDR
jgi:hypothetical protein